MELPSNHALARAPLINQKRMEWEIDLSSLVDVSVKSHSFATWILVISCQVRSDQTCLNVAIPVFSWMQVSIGMRRLANFMMQNVGACCFLLLQVVVAVVVAGSCLQMQENTCMYLFVVACLSCVAAEGCSTSSWLHLTLT